MGSLPLPHPTPNLISFTLSLTPLHPPWFLCCSLNTLSTNLPQGRRIYGSLFLVQPGPQTYTWIPSFLSGFCSAVTSSEQLILMYNSTFYNICHPPSVWCLGLNSTFWHNLKLNFFFLLLPPQNLNSMKRRTLSILFPLVYPARWFEWNYRSEGAVVLEENH